MAGGYGFANLDRHKVSSEGLCGRVSVPNLFPKAKRNFFIINPRGGIPLQGHQALWSLMLNAPQNPDVQGGAGRVAA